MKKIIKSIAIITILAVSASMLFACGKKETVGDYVYPDTYGKAVDASKLEFDGEVKAIKFAEGATTKQKIETIINTAQYNVDHAKYLGSVQTGGGWAMSGEKIGGNLSFCFATVVDNGNIYKNNIIRVTEAKKVGPVDLVKIVRNKLDSAERSYFDATTSKIYTQKKKGAKANCGIDATKYPYGKASFGSDVTEEDYNEEYIKANYLKSGLLDFTKLQMTAATISDEGLSIEEKDGLYTISFKLKLATDEEKTLATGEFARPSMREASGTEDLEYPKFDVTIECYANGLIKTFHSDEEWAASMDLGILGVKQGGSKSKNDIIFTWDKSQASLAYLKESGADTEWWK